MCACQTNVQDSGHAEESGTVPALSAVSCEKGMLVLLPTTALAVPLNYRTGTATMIC